MIFILLILAFVAWGLIYLINLMRIDTPTRIVDPAKQQAEIQYQHLWPQVNRIVEESVSIINQTKNIDVAIGRFGIIKDKIALLIQLAGPVLEDHKFAVEIEYQTIKNTDELYKIDDVKEKYIRRHFIDKVELELQKAAVLEDTKRKKKQLEKALAQALKAMEYIKDDSDIKLLINNVEKLIEELDSGKIEKEIKPRARKKIPKPQITHLEKTYNFKGWGVNKIKIMGDPDDPICGKYHNKTFEVAKLLDKDIPMHHQECCCAITFADDDL